MPEPTTPNTGMIVPNTGDLPGAWGTTALNTNFSLIDGYFGGETALSLSSATTITLTGPVGSITPTGGITQAQVAAIGLQGTLSGNVTIRLPVPGIFRVFNACVAGSNFVMLQSSFTTGGITQGVPDGEFHHFYHDGTNVFNIDYPHVAQLINLCVSTTPAWFGGCTTAPYLLCNGALYNVATFPQLGARLGNTFGGNGITTFGVPDMQSRYFMMTDLAGVNRITSGGSGINGTQFGASGGSEFLQQHSHPNALTDSGHFHQFPGGGAVPTFSGGGTPWQGGGANGTISQTAPSNSNITITNANAGVGSSQNVPPALVGGLTFIKT